MCGIAGYIGEKQIAENLIYNTIEVMKNRGPDFQKFESFYNHNLHIVLIHSRLSIIDLDTRSNQPYVQDHCSLIFNGEIYNYIELRKELEELGIQFKTESDTEVLLQSYLYYGEKCVEKFEGMWSFAIYDRIEHKLFLSRDRFGEKPLYYFESSDGFYFASEIKALRELSGIKFSINQDKIYSFLVNSHKSLYKTKTTFFNDVTEIEFATNYVLKEKVLKKYKYWFPKYDPKVISEDEAVKLTRHYLLKSIKQRLRSDVPLAFCLSGGVDSSALVSLASKELNYNVTTFSIIDQDKRYNELENIQHTIRDTGCENHKIFLNPKENYFNRLENLVEYHDSPISTISYLIHSLISEAVSKRGFRISISGTGADEIFSGYYDHFNLHMYEMRNDFEFDKYVKDWKDKVLKYVRNPYLKQYDLYIKTPSFRKHVFLNSEVFSGFLNVDFNDSFKEEFYSKSVLRNRMLNEMFHEVVPVILHEDDLNSMYYSVENRSPYLDKNLFEFIYSVPNRYLVKDGFAKYLLRQSVKDVLNEKVRIDREKRGFNASINSIVDFKNKTDIEYILDDSNIFDFVNKNEIEKFIKREEFPNSFKKFMFSFLSTKCFLTLN